MKKFVVGILLGGVIGDPNFHIEFLKLIEADSESKAVDTYIKQISFNITPDRICVIGEFKDNRINIPIELIKKLSFNNNTISFIDKLLKEI